MERKQPFFLSHLTFLGILVAILFLLFYNSQFLPNAASATEYRMTTSSARSILPLTEDMGEEYIKDIIFLGESTTYGLWHYGVLPDEKNTTNVWTGATVQNGSICCAGTLSLSPSISQAKLFYPDTGEALTVSEALLRKQPKFLVITLGLNNGASYYTEDEFKQCYRTLLNTAISASQDTAILLQSIFPVAKSCKIRAYTPEKIRLCNSWILDLAEEYGLGFLDTFSALADTEGYLKEEFDNGGDGIHLNHEGLLAVLHYVRTHGYTEET
jgi:lysophospholipase L1-like esterase